MNLNNWLCKHFDKEKKGYVNVGDVFDVAFIPTCILFAVFFVIGVVSAVLQGLITDKYPDTISELIIVLLKDG